MQAKPHSMFCLQVYGSLRKIVAGGSILTVPFCFPIAICLVLNNASPCFIHFTHYGYFSNFTRKIENKAANDNTPLKEFYFGGRN